MEVELRGIHDRVSGLKLWRVHWFFRIFFTGGHEPIANRVGVCVYLFTYVHYDMFIDSRSY